jgi:hypothetical protein
METDLKHLSRESVKHRSAILKEGKYDFKVSHRENVNAQRMTIHIFRWVQGKHGLIAGKTEYSVYGFREESTSMFDFCRGLILRLENEGYKPKRRSFTLASAYKQKIAEEKEAEMPDGLFHAYFYVLYCLSKMKAGSSVIEVRERLSRSDLLGKFTELIMDKTIHTSRHGKVFYKLTKINDTKELIDLIQRNKNKTWKN